MHVSQLYVAISCIFLGFFVPTLVYLLTLQSFQMLFSIVTACLAIGKTLEYCDFENATGLKILNIFLLLVRQCGK